MYPDAVEVLAVQVRSTECWMGATPVPESAIVVGDPLALLTIEIVPGTLPADVGLNCRERTRFCEGERVTGALPPVIA